MEKLIKLSFNKVKQHTFPKFYNTLFRFGGGRVAQLSWRRIFCVSEIKKFDKTKSDNNEDQLNNRIICFWDHPFSSVSKNVYQEHI